MKLSESSKAVILLRKKLRTGEIVLSDNPKTVWASEPDFMAHKLPNFRTKFNKIKAEQDRSEGDGIIGRCSVDDEVARKKPKLNPSDDDAIPSMICKESSQEDLLQPLHVVSEWIEPGTTTKRLSLAILLPLEVSSGQCSVCVAEDGCALEFSVCWPNPMIDLNVLHHKWLSSTSHDKIEKYHPKLIGFESFLKAHRACSSDSIESTCRIPLPVQVQTQISSKYNLAWSDNFAKIVYVELRGQEEQYGTMQDSNWFEIR